MTNSEKIWEEDGEKIWWDTDDNGEIIKETENAKDSDEENREWFIERAEIFEFHPVANWCSMCGDREAHYNGITQAVDGLNLVYNGVIFQFCKICRDELQMIKLQTIASRERIGA